MGGSLSRLAARCLAVVVAALAVAGVLIQPLPLDQPMAIGGDTLEHAVLVGSASWFGEPGTSTRNGAPHGVDWSWAPSGGERVPLAAMAVLVDLTGGLWSGINLFVLLAVAATALIGFLVLRWMGVGDLVAGCGGIVFAFLPAVHDHLELGHLFLFALYPIPLTVYLGLRWTRWNGAVPNRADLPGWRVLAPTVAAVVLVGLSSTYYALFAVLLISMLAAIAGLRQMDWRAARPGMFVSLSVAALFVISSVPGRLSGAPRLERRVSDSIRFALDPVEALFPQSENLLGITEGWGSPPAQAVGVAALCGLIVLGVWITRSGARMARAGAMRNGGMLRAVDCLDSGLMWRLAGLIGGALVIGVAGGVGWLIARVGFQELRAWSRVSTVVSFVGISVLGLWATEVVRLRSEATQEPSPVPAAARGVLPVVVGLTLVALIEQRSMLPDRELVHSQWAEDKGLSQQMEARLPDDAQVFVIPAGTFLSDLGPGRMLAPSLTDGTLRWSVGSFRGGSGDWQQTWALEEPGDQAVVAAAAGFEALAVQVDSHLLEDPEATHVDLVSLLGAPAGISAQGAWEWFDLLDLRSDLIDEHGKAVVNEFGMSAVRPLGVVMHGTPGFPSAATERTVMVGEASAIEVFDRGGSSVPVVVTFDLVTAPGAVVRLDNGSQTKRIEVAAGTERVTMRLPLTTEGSGKLRISVDGESLVPAGDDPAVSAELAGIQVFDVGLANSRILRPRHLR